MAIGPGSIVTGVASRAAGLIVGLLATVSLAQELTPDFAREVRPILSRNCFACHGNDDATIEAGLRLDQRDSATADRGGRAAIVPGDPDASEILIRIRSDDPDVRMPPPGTGHTVTADEIAVLTRWIEAGSPWADHWSFTPPTRADRPPLARATWPAEPLDAFTLAAMEARDLTPTDDASRATWLRRVTLDLTGLPPTPEEIDAFLADAGPTAFARVADRLLASAAYGERAAQPWLDLARYADSDGYEKDLPRTIWRYRDWVINALNSDMPFDQFTREQLAGDLLPEATETTRLATAFHRNTMTNTEGGTDDEEFRTAAVIDRTSTTLQVWMGLTVGCAQCHNHKYDPISQAEFFQLYDFFNHTADNDQQGNPPVLATPSADERRRRDELTNRLERLTVESFGPSPDWDSALQAVQAWKPTTTPVMVELPRTKRRTTRVFLGGSFLAPGETVEAGVPAALHPWQDTWPRDRLGLAHWLTDGANPLTARVAANRVWEMIFGRGLVETSEDFGSQGTPPTHPELLDELALDLQQSGWSLKRLVRKIVLSRTYRQDATAAAETIATDPRNIWLSRMPRVRLDAETVRDQALAMSGRLTRRIGGRSAMPRQPDGLWEVVYSGESWKTPDGPDAYRRSVYTFLRRTSPYPSQLLFDGTSREVCSIRRIRTNTPLQALVTLNDPVWMEAAQAIARTVILEITPLRQPPSDIVSGDASSRTNAETAADTVAIRLAAIARRVVGRDLTMSETDRLREYFQAERDRLARDPQAARKLATEPLGPLPPGWVVTEAAAWTMVASVLLNLDETLTRP